MRDENEAVRAVEKHADTVRRICFIHLKNYHDAEDVFQEVFLKYVLYDGVFDSDEHERAWLIRVAVNACKDLLKGFFRRRVTYLEDAGHEPFYVPEESRGLIDAVCALPHNYRDAVYLFYYEGYKASEIAMIMGKKENTIYTWLARAKTKLKDALGGDYLDE